VSSGVSLGGCVLLLRGKVADLAHVVPPLAPPELYSLSLHDALPILFGWHLTGSAVRAGIDMISRYRKHSSQACAAGGAMGESAGDRKSTRLNSSHVKISYAVFCLRKKSVMRSALQHGGQPARGSQRA